MHHDYRSIRTRIAGEPKWFDANGVPRYEVFRPQDCPNIYARQVVLLSIACQACGQQFDVEMHGHWFAPIESPRELHYGDPPAHGCVGDTMNCEDLEVLQVWHHERFDWCRQEDLEGAIDGH